MITCPLCGGDVNSEHHCEECNFDCTLIVKAEQYAKMIEKEIKRPQQGRGAATLILPAEAELPATMGKQL